MMAPEKFSARQPFRKRRSACMA